MKALPKATDQAWDDMRLITSWILENTDLDDARILAFCKLFKDLADYMDAGLPTTSIKVKPSDLQ